jgi:GT2 family glycosyltransferase
MCLGADIRKGENQKPFDGKIDYDYIMWIDSDIIFTVKDFNKLLLNNVDICGGIYLTEDDIHFAAVKNWDESKLQHQGTFDFLTRNDINKNPNPIEVAYTGFGFLLIKYGVFEKIKYPWFSPKFYKIGDCHDFSSEDVSFCTKAKENGFKIYIDPTVWVKHQKLKLL